MNEQQNSSLLGRRKLMVKDKLKQFIGMIWSGISALLFSANVDFQLFRLTPDMSIVQFEHLSSR